MRVRFLGKQIIQEMLGYDEFQTIASTNPVESSEVGMVFTAASDHAFTFLHWLLISLGLPWEGHMTLD